MVELDQFKYRISGYDAQIENIKQSLDLDSKKKRIEELEADQLILVTGVVALVIMTLSILFRWQILNLIYKGVTEEVMKNAVIYLTISAISYPFLAVYNSCAALFRRLVRELLYRGGKDLFREGVCYQALVV